MNERKRRFDVALAATALRGFVEPHLDLGLAAEVRIVTVLLGGVGSVDPAWRAVRLNPVEVLKYE